MEGLKGKMLIVSAPSGAGKTTLVKHLLTQIPDLGFSVSATSRPKRENETDGKDYHFLSVEQFRQKIAEGAFLEWEEVYNGVYYGTLLHEVEAMLAQGRHLIFDVDVVGGLNIKKHYGAQALSVFIQAPSLEVLEQRLRSRCSDPEESIRQRIDKARWEMGFAPQFDLVFVNDDLNIAREKLTFLVNEFLHH
ncbi:MAG: guanylate kinase [Bacteroidales bacterium]|nr:guanylate kinase [Bacteroidales bacterium]